jgi:hypothetical protein
MRGFKNRALNLRDALLGLGSSMLGWVPVILIFTTVLAGFIFLFGLWRGVTTVKFTNESTVTLENTSVTDRTLDGVESRLWSFSLPANDETYRLTFGCCDYIVVKFQFEAYEYELLCRYPDWEDFPEFSVVIHRSGFPYCEYPRAMREPACMRTDLRVSEVERKKAVCEIPAN